MTRFSLILLTSLALIAFAGNSVLNRLALASGSIDAASFTLVRLLSGACLLSLILLVRGLTSGEQNWINVKGSWAGALSLLGYALLFSFAYIVLDAGLGALLLFVSVQITMLGWGLKMGERLSGMAWLGLFAALIGLFILLWPSERQMLPPLAVIAMIGSGVSWGIYSLLGRGSVDPTAQTGGNFIRASGVALILFTVWIGIAPQFDAPLFFTPEGLVWASLSGAVTSGLGYAIWYAVLPSLSANRAGVLQLSVPPLAALGGILFLGEALSARFVLASLIILGGIALATMKTPKRNR